MIRQTTSNARSLSNTLVVSYKIIYIYIYIYIYGECSNSYVIELAIQECCDVTSDFDSPPEWTLYSYILFWYEESRIKAFSGWERATLWRPYFMYAYADSYTRCYLYTWMHAWGSILMWQWYMTKRAGTNHLNRTLFKLFFEFWSSFCFSTPIYIQLSRTDDVIEVLECVASHLYQKWILTLASYILFGSKNLTSKGFSGLDQATLWWAYLLYVFLCGIHICIVTHRCLGGV